jgi:hypothetical protein
MDDAYKEFRRKQQQQGEKDVPETLSAALQKDKWKQKVVKWAHDRGNLAELGFLADIFKYEDGGQPNWPLADTICEKYLESGKVRHYYDEDIISIIRVRIDSNL